MKTTKPKIHVTEFQQRVYDACQKIPVGRVATYAALAREIGCDSPRAVGRALGVNPFAPQVPCHRVIRSDGSIGGFKGETSGSPIQQKLLRLSTEGIRFVRGKLAPEHCLFEFKK